MSSTPSSSATAPAACILVAALYRFARFDVPEAVAEQLRMLCGALDIRGTLIVAQEGINGTVAGAPEAVHGLIDRLRTLPGCADLDVKYSQAAQMPFGRLKVKVKTEIVTLGVGELDAARGAGFHVEPSDWNQLIADPDTIVIDTRNQYEVAIGSFARAINPQTRAFREFPQWFDALAAELQEQGRTPRIAMFCTGGIRCEKSTALAKARGFEEVYHLKGGILRYLEEMPAEESLWSGDCFVFDERVAVTHGLGPGRHILCRACGTPYERGAAPACHCDQG